MNKTPLIFVLAVIVALVVIGCATQAQAMLNAGWMYDASQRREHVQSATVTAIGLPSIPPGDPRNPKG